jgi:hypothetical protein
MRVRKAATEKDLERRKNLVITVRNIFDELEKMGKPILPVLCHGRNHKPLLPEWTSRFSVVLFDDDKDCRPDVVMDIQRDLDILIPFGPFDAIVFVFPPSSLLLSDLVKETLKKMIHPSGELIFHKKKDFGLKGPCKKCKSYCTSDFFTSEVKHCVYPFCRVFHTKVRGKRRR